MAGSGRTRVLILGGGFGLYAAVELEKTLARDPNVEITLVNGENFFLCTLMLYEVAASDLDLTNIVNPIRKLLKRVNFLAGEVEAIDVERKLVTVSHGFDHHPRLRARELTRFPEVRDHLRSAVNTILKRTSRQSAKMAVARFTRARTLPNRSYLTTVGQILRPLCDHISNGHWTQRQPQGSSCP